MTILKDVLVELFGMFVSDGWLSLGILLLVAGAAGLIELVGIDPLIGGGLLLAGCLVVVIESVRRAARRHLEALRS